MNRPKKALKRALALVIPFLLSISAASAAPAAANRMFGKLYGWMSNNYFQYFFLLGGVTFTVSILVKGAMDTGPLKNTITNEKHRSTIAAIVGIGTANGVFFALKGVGGVSEQIAQLLSIFFGIIALAILAGGLYMIGKFLKEAST